MKKYLKNKKMWAVIVVLGIALILWQHLPVVA